MIYHCLDMLADMQEPSGSAELLQAAQEVLSEEDFAEFGDAVHALEGAPPRLPVAVFSFEGSLMSCDVDGWAEDWAEQPEPPKGEDWIEEALNDPLSEWTWDMARHCCGSLVARCACDPPRHLASIERWLRLPGSPGFVYVAGKQSKASNKVVFPALREIAVRSSSEKRLQIFEIPGSGHNLNHDAPDRVRDMIAKVLGL